MCVFQRAPDSPGNDYGLSAFHGVDRAGRFRIYSIGPTGKLFNFADAVDDAGTAPEMFWLAKRFSTPVYTWSEQKALEHARAEASIWHGSTVIQISATTARPGARRDFPGRRRGMLPQRVGRPECTLYGRQGRGQQGRSLSSRPRSFVLDAGGVRWAADLGPDDYDLPGYFGRQRWSYYRLRTESHNTLLIDDQNQDPRAEARITRQEFAPDLTWVQIDLSRANPGKVRQWTGG